MHEHSHSREREAVIILKRKLLTAILSSLLFTLILSTPDWLEGDLFFNLYYLNLLIAITYGVIVSIFSDWLSRKLTKRAYTREIISFIFHCCGGVLFLFPGFVSAIVFFVADRFLKKVKIGWLSVIIALLMVVLVFVILINK